MATNKDRAAFCDQRMRVHPSQPGTTDAIFFLTSGNVREMKARIKTNTSAYSGCTTTTPGILMPREGPGAFWSEILPGISQNIKKVQHVLPPNTLTVF